MIPDGQYHWVASDDLPVEVVVESIQQHCRLEHQEVEGQYIEGVLTDIDQCPAEGIIPLGDV
jgi:hypothetical protein